MEDVLELLKSAYSDEISIDRERNALTLKWTNNTTITLSFESFEELSQNDCSSLKNISIASDLSNSVVKKMRDMLLVYAESNQDNDDEIEIQDNSIFDLIQYAISIVDGESELQEARLQQDNVKDQNREDVVSSRCSKRVLVWFHHIYSGKKKSFIVNESANQNVGGIWCDGAPGVLMAEGSVCEVDDFVRSLKRLQWKEITVRGEEIVETTIAESRVLPFPLLKVDTVGMMAKICRDTGCEDLWNCLAKT
jgi:hypothetical protein